MDQLGKPSLRSDPGVGRELGKCSRFPLFCCPIGLKTKEGCLYSKYIQGSPREHNVPYVRRRRLKARQGRGRGEFIWRLPCHLQQGMYFFRKP